MGPSEEILLNKLGGQIRARRKELGWTQEELAKRGRVHRSYLADVERGSRNISILTLERIATAMDDSISHLCSGIASGLSSKTR